MGESTGSLIHFLISFSGSYVTQIYFCGKNKFLPFFSTLNYCFQPCVCPSSNYICSFLTSPPADAVVLWDWLTSLPREWRFVYPPLFLVDFLLKSGPIGLENALDSSQGRIFVLSASISSLLPLLDLIWSSPFNLYTSFFLLVTGSLGSFHTSCSVS